MFGATVLSAVLHVVAIAATIVAWPYVAPPEFPSDVVPIEMVDLADETNITPQEETKETPEPAPEPQQLAMPEMAPPQPAFEPPPPPEDDAPALEEETKPEEPPKPVPPAAQRFAAVQPRIKPKPEPPKKDAAKDFDAMMSNLNLDDAPKKKEPPAKSAKQEARAGAGAQSALTMDEVAALKGRLAKCWNVPVGAPDPASLVFRVRFSLNQDGTVASPPQLLDQGRLGDPYFRAAADAAIRAINICGPYELPAEKYAGAGGWNEITIEFDPTKMAGY